MWWCDKRNLTFLTCIVVENTSRYTIKWNVFNVFTNCISCNWCIKWLYCVHVMARPCVILCWQIFATVHICIALLDLNYFRFAIEIHTIETSLHWLIGDSWCNILYSLTSFPWMAGPGILHRPFCVILLNEYCLDLSYWTNMLLCTELSSLVLFAWMYYPHTLLGVVFIETVLFTIMFLFIGF